jgi:GntR family transcriptional regulator
VSEVLYLSIVEKLKKKIMENKYKPGDMLESEAAMMKEFHASRMTIRKSLSLLSNEGYIYSVPGKGSFICVPETNLYQFRFNKYEDLIVPIEEVKLLDVSVIEGDGEDAIGGSGRAGASEKIREKLRIRSSGEKILKASRILLSGGKNVAVEYIYFMYQPNRPVVESQLKFANHLEGIEQQLAFSLKKELHISCARPGDEVRAFLGCGSGEMVFCLEERVINGDSGRVYSFTEFHVLPRHFALNANTVKEENGIKKIF